MDWTQVFVILGVFLGAFLWLASKIDNISKDLRSDIKDVRSDVQKLGTRIQSIENRLEFSNKVVYIQHEELKEE